MSARDFPAEQFEANRARLSAVAYRMLGSHSEAEDAVQEAWLRLNRADASGVDNLGGWLTTVVARICLDVLRQRKSRREEPLAFGETVPEPAAPEPGPDHELQLADSVGLAMLVVLNTLAPAERIAFVLHDMFDLPFEAIAPIVDRTPAAARQLASRARRRVRGTPAVPDSDLERQRAVVEAFLAASRQRNFEGLLAVLDPDVVFRHDPTAVPEGAEMEVRGSSAVAAQFSGRAKVTQAALIDGEVGISVGPRSRPAMVMRVTFVADVIARLEVVADPERLAHLDLEVLND
jgi:RNA polymerase sigma factor (sigma-70 family)